MKKILGLFQMLMAFGLVSFSLNLYSQPAYDDGYPKIKIEYSTPVTNEIYQDNMRIASRALVVATTYYLVYTVKPSPEPDAQDVVAIVDGTSTPAGLKQKGKFSMPMVDQEYSALIEDFNKSNTGYFVYVVMKNDSGYSPLVKKTVRYRLNAKLMAQSYYYVESLPQNYSPSSGSYPLMIFLHGIGERGSTIQSLSKVLVNGPPKEVTNSSTKYFPMIILSPQSPVTQDADPSTDSWNVAKLDAFITAALARYPRADPDRIYLTGLSMGGFGTWRYALKYPNRLAAIVPISGGGAENKSLACNLKNMPIWAFHDSTDHRAPTSHTLEMETLIRGCEPNDVEKINVTLLKTFNNPTSCDIVAQHSVWNMAYSDTPSPASVSCVKELTKRYTSANDNITIYNWLLQFSKNPNNAPQVNAGNDKSVTLPDTDVSLQGSATDDGSITSYTWSKQSGPTAGGGDIASPSNASTNITNLKEGTYVFRLTVKDNLGLTSFDDVEVVVSPAPGDFKLFINSGGELFSQDGKDWEGDKTHPYLDLSYPSGNTGGTASLAGTNTTNAPSEVIGSYRNSTTRVQYNIPVPEAGQYFIQLYFGRKNSDAFVSGDRRFEIKAEEITKRTYDVYDEAWSGASSFTFSTEVTDGILNLAFVPVSGSKAQINGIAIEKVSGNNVQPLDLFLNAGGEIFDDGTQEWEGDRPHPYLDQSFITGTTGGTASLAGTNNTDAPDEVVGSYRNSTTTVQYNIPVPASGTYALKLYFARKNSDAFVSGDREFNIKTEGVTRRTYDVYDNAWNGADSVMMNTSVTDGVLNLAFVALTGSKAQINGIRVEGPLEGLSGSMAAKSAEPASVFSDDAGQQPVSVYPNKVKNVVRVSGIKENAELSIYTNQGNRLIIHETELTGGETEVDLTSLKPGLYILVVRHGASIERIRLIKE